MAALIGIVCGLYIVAESIYQIKHLHGLRDPLAWCEYMASSAAGFWLLWCAAVDTVNPSEAGMGAALALLLLRLTAARMRPYVELYREILK